MQSVVAQGDECSETLRLKGPPRKIIKVEAKINATKKLEFAIGTAT